MKHILHTVLLAVLVIGLATGCSDDEQKANNIDATKKAGADSSTEAGTDSSTEAGADSSIEAGSDSEAEAGEPTPATINGYFEKVDGMDVLWMWGTPYEMGYAEGALLCNKLTVTLEEMVLGNEYIGAFGVDLIMEAIRSVVIIPESAERQAEGIVQGLRDHCPEEDRIIRSEYVEGGEKEIEPEDILIQNFNGPVFALIRCSSLSVWGEASATGATIQGRNVDTGSADTFLGARLDHALVKIYQDAERGNARWLSLNLPGRSECVSCMDETGAAFMSHWAGSSTLPHTETTNLVTGAHQTINALIAIRDAEDKIKLVDEMFDSQPITGGGNLHLCLPCDSDDCIGGAVFERDGFANHKDGRATLRLPGDVDDGMQTNSAIVCTNHFIKRIVNTWTEGSIERYQILVDGINEGLQKGGLDVDDVLELMKAVAVPEISAPTYYTTIIDTSTRTLYLRYGKSNDEQAPWMEPHTLSLDELFGRFPKY